MKKIKGFTPKNFYEILRGFTLLELIIVIVILGILVGVGITNYTTSIERARGEAYINNIRTILSAWRIYNLKEPPGYTTNPKGSDSPVSWINNKFQIFITESYYGYGSTPGAILTSNTTADANNRFLQVSGKRIGNRNRYVLCKYYYLRDANQWEWDGNNFPWLP